MSASMSACAKSIELETCRTTTLPAVPCHVGDPDLWFAESPVDLERAKALCIDCPIRRECLAAALDRGEPWGVWGGEILERGTIVARKRPRGRPRKDAEPAAA
jgi:WhiB family transcriptional regulator, redox-sensing transcriptional regulator